MRRMSSRLTLHAGPAVGFDQPFEMLAACHERVQRSLALLLKLQAHVEVHGPDAQARDAARDVLRYFDIAGPAHHEDEERHVLPRLRACDQAALADRLRADHQRMSETWARLRQPLLHWAAGEAAAMDKAMLQDYISLYTKHIAAEEAHAYPASAVGLSDEALRLMGEEMAARRRRPAGG